MQGTILGKSGGSFSGLNVYAQLAEPSKKDGIWIKTEETTVGEKTYPQIPKYKYEAVNIVSELESKYTRLVDIPYQFTRGSTVTIRKFHIFTWRDL